MDTQFKLGQIIKHKDSLDSDFGEVVSIIINKTGVLYTIALKEFDRETRKLVDAVTHIAEEDAVEQPKVEGAEGNPGEGV